MKTTCSVIQDLLPLYCDDACSAESRRLVEEHLKECDDCRETYQLMQAALPASAAHTQQQATAQAAQAWKKQGSTSFFKGCLVVLASVILLFLGIALQHWCTTAPLVFPHLAKNAEAYFEAQGRALSFSYEAGHVRGGYMASLLYDYNSETYYIGLFERDSLFHSRWRCCGGVVGFEAGQMTSYNYSDPEGNAILIFAGVMLPKEAKWYTFTNGGIVYTCPIEGEGFTDLFVIADGRGDINGYPTLLDEDMQPIA